VEIGRQIPSTFCLVDTARDPSQRIFGETRFNGRNITRADRVTQRLTDQQMQKLRDLQKQKQDEKDKCFNDAVSKKREGMDQVARETPPISSLLTGEDAGIIGATSVLTSAYQAYKNAETGVEVGAGVGAGVESGVLAVVGILLYRGVRQTVGTGLSYDEVSAQYKKEYDLCVAKHGPSNRPVSLSSVARSVN
jgi:hypothetical protein